MYIQLLFRTGLILKVFINTDPIQMQHPSCPHLEHSKEILGFSFLPGLRNRNQRLSVPFYTTVIIFFSAAR